MPLIWTILFLRKGSSADYIVEAGVVDVISEAGPFGIGAGKEPIDCGGAPTKAAAARGADNALSVRERSGEIAS